MASMNGTGWRQRSSGFLASIAAIVLIVVLLGGMAIGYPLERGSETSPPKIKAKHPSENAPYRFVGTVSLTAAKSISITPTKGANRRIVLAKGTIVVKAGAGAASDIAPNVKVVYGGAGSFTKAKSVIVLPRTARLGSMVTATDATTMSLRNGTKVLKITTTGATVDKVSPAKIADVVKGTKVMVATLRTKAGVLVATEIILLTANSTFQ
jgi:uncharacterized protein (UPF0333 family)